MDPGPISLKERRRRFAAGVVERTALDLFAERGYDNVTVDEIASACGISARTFFRYFANKHDVLLDAQRHAYQRLLDAYRARPESEGAVTALREALAETSSLPHAERAGVRRRVRVLNSDPSLSANSAALLLRPGDQLKDEAARRMGVDAERDPMPSVVVSAMNAAATAAFSHWVWSSRTDNPAKAIVEAVDLVISGLSAFDEPKRPPRNGRAGPPRPHRREPRPDAP